MKKLAVCLMSFFLTIGASFAIDNFGRGETFDGETGLKTGAQLEDLVTQATWVAGAVSTANADRLFNTTQFEIGTDSTTTAATNVMQIKTGGIGSDEILDGSITEADLSAGVLTDAGSLFFIAELSGEQDITTATEVTVLFAVNTFSNVISVATNGVFTPTTNGVYNISVNVTDTGIQTAGGSGKTECSLYSGTNILTILDVKASSARFTTVGGTISTHLTTNDTVSVRYYTDVEKSGSPDTRIATTVEDGTFLSIALIKKDD